MTVANLKLCAANSDSDATDEKERDDLDIPLFDYVQVANATDNFSSKNKLGVGGFGTVYKVTALIRKSYAYSRVQSKLQRCTRIRQELFLLALDYRYIVFNLIKDFIIEI